MMFPTLLSKPNLSTLPNNHQIKEIVVSQSRNDVFRKSASVSISTCYNYAERCDMLNVLSRPQAPKNFSF
jgi:hypothetical protein